jgi:hypothetical protein
MGEHTDTPAKPDTETPATSPPPVPPRTAPRPRGRWRVVVWGLSAAFAILMWSFLYATDAARLIGAWADVGLIFWTGLVVEGFVAALLDGFVDGFVDPHVAAVAWAGCTACGGRVPFAAGERQARCPFCDATVLPPVGRRAILGPRIFLIAMSFAAIAIGAANASHAPLLRPFESGLILAAICVAASALPFRRYFRNQPG